MVRHLAIAISFFSAVACAADPPEDQAVTLARILAGKGTISASELSTVEGTSAGDRVAMLAAILQRKGVLSDTEVAQFHVPAAAKPVVTAKAPPATGPQTADLPVTTHAGVSVSLYGTLLLNAFYNTAATNIQDLPLFAAKQGSDPTGGDKNSA